MEEGRLRLEAVGLLVPQHQIVSRIDDDLLQAHKGAQEPGGTGGRRGAMENMATDRDCSPPQQEEPSADLPTDCPARPFFRAVGKDVDPAGRKRGPPPDAIVCHNRLLGGAGDGVVVLEEAQSAPSFRQKGEVRERVLAGQSRAAGVSSSQTVQYLRTPAQREGSHSCLHDPQVRPAQQAPSPSFPHVSARLRLQALLVHSKPIWLLLKPRRLILLPLAWKRG